MSASSAYSGPSLSSHSLCICLPQPAALEQPIGYLSSGIADNIFDLLAFLVRIQDPLFVTFYEE